ncbi:MAG: hypothetical protein ACP5H2_05195 [Solirubrobacteraceae bacterium]
MLALITGLVALLAFGVVGVRPAFADTSSYVQSAEALQLPANQYQDDYADAAWAVYGTACASAGSCVAVGYYAVGSSLFTRPVVFPVTDGVPGTALEVQQPTGAIAGDGSLTGISCSSATSCVAVGSYKNAGTSLPLLVPIVGGVPQAAQTPSLPSGATSPPSNGTQHASLDWATCPATGACEAVGAYYNSSALEQTDVVSISGGVPGFAVAVTPPAGYASGDPYVGVAGLSCSSASLCVAPGYYYGSGVDYAAVTIVIGPTGPSVQETALPSGAAQTDSEFDAGYTSAAVCVPSAPCLSTGWYYTANGPVGPTSILQ